MKKFFMIAACLFAVSATQAQLGGLVDKATKTAASVGIDVKSVTNSIMGKLVPGLGLTAPQNPQVTDAVSGFLTKKADILPLQSSNPAEYTKKQSGLFSGLQSKLSGILLKDQMNKFLGMKPATNNPSNVLSQLFY